MATKENALKRHKVLTALVVIVALIVIGSVASGGKDNVNTTATNTATNSSNSSAKKPATAHVGDTVNVGGGQGLAITLQKVIDPASSGNQYVTASAGKRFVAVKLEIKNNGKGSYQDDANVNATLVGSDNQSYTADFDSISGCTNFSNGEYTLAANESATGCVVFQVPNSVQPAKLQFQTVSGFDSSTGKWLIP